MADDRRLTGLQDRSQISLSEDYEVRYWTQKFGVSEEEWSHQTDEVEVQKLLNAPIIEPSTTGRTLGEKRYRSWVARLCLCRPQSLGKKPSQLPFERLCRTANPC
jgi:Protein of unknown function (DUF3606)